MALTQVGKLEFLFVPTLQLLDNKLAAFNVYPQLPAAFTKKHHR